MLHLNRVDLEETLILISKENYFAALMHAYYITNFRVFFNDEQTL
jgi:hypothetical protein